MTIVQSAAIYVRISRDSESEGLGVRRQERDCAELAATLGWSVTETFIDNDVSASRKKARPAYEQMMAAVRARRIQAVIVWDVDRLTRKPRELEDWIDHADSLGLKLASVGGEIDLATVQGRAMARMKGVFARMEAETASRRQRAKQKELAEAGQYNGPRPFGYRFGVDEAGRRLSGPQRTLEVDLAEATILVECARRILAHQSLWAIVKDLNSRGVVTSTGAAWSTQQLRRVLLRWTHVGYRKHQEYKDGRWVGPIQLVEASWPAIIDRSTHERVLAVLTNPERTTNHGSTTSKYLLSWLLTCGACGQRMVGVKPYTYEVKGSKRVDGSRGPSKVRHYKAKYACPHAGCHGASRDMVLVDDYVEAHVLALLETEGVQVFGGDRELVETTRTEICELEAKLDLFGDDLVDGKLTEREWDRMTTRIRDRLREKQAVLRAALPTDGLSGYAGDSAKTAWSNADVSIRRRVLQTLMTRGGLCMSIDPVGPGAFSDASRDRNDGISVRWSQHSDD